MVNPVLRGEDRPVQRVSLLWLSQEEEEEEEEEEAMEAESRQERR